MKDKLTVFFIWFFIIAIFALPFLAEYSYVIEDMQINPFDYARITDVEYKAVVVDEPGSLGKVVITERLTFDIHAASKSNPFWELWRDLPEDIVDGVPVHYKVNSVKQILPDGSEVIYEESPKLYWDDYDYVNTNPIYGPGKWYHSEGPYDEEEAQYECVFFYVDGMYREKPVFEIEYEMYNAALKYNDCSDLYLALYSGSTVKHLNSFKAQILFPEEDMPSYGNYSYYTYGTNSNSFAVTESDSINPGYHTFSFQLDKDDLKFKPYNQYIEFDLLAYGEDKHIFTEYAQPNDYTYDNVLDEVYAEQTAYANAPNTFKIIKLVVLVISLIGAALVLLYAFRADSRMRSKYIFYKPEMQFDYFREIPSDLDPNFAAKLAFCKQKAPKDDSGVYSAILLSLARKNYIELQEMSNNDVLIIIKNPPKIIPRQTMPPNMPWQMQQNMAWQTSAPNMGMQNPYMNNSMGMPNPYMNNSMGMQNPYINNGIGIPAPTMNTANMDVETPTPDISVEEPDTEYEPLTTCEQYYFNLLVRHVSDNRITMKAFQSRVSRDYANTDSFVRNMDSSIVDIGINEGYFQKANYMQPMKQMQSKSTLFMVLGIIFITLVNIISYNTRMDLAFGSYFIFGIACIVCSVMLKRQSYKYILLTPFGEDEYEKWHGLYNFLNSETLMKERTVIELPLWEKYLVYAAAFGISDKVIKAISIRCPEASSSAILNNNYCRSGRIHHSSRSFRSSVRSGSHAARSGGGGFGYGGGGRGGGGGGGGH